MVKLDKPIDFVTGKTSPIGLPDKKYNEIGKNVYVAGQGFVYQQSWHTNGDGPEPYTECAPGAVFEGKKLDQEYGCQQGHSPSMEKVDGKENPCFHFNYQQKNKVHTSSNSYKCAWKDKRQTNKHEMVYSSDHSRKCKMAKKAICPDSIISFDEIPMLCLLIPCLVRNFPLGMKHMPPMMQHRK